MANQTIINQGAVMGCQIKVSDMVLKIVNEHVELRLEFIPQETFQDLED
ncbi:MAG: hypothetical protein AAGA75_02920 [Cyanobacteria bacterium P01_E01_bin.6]